MAVLERLLVSAGRHGNNLDIASTESKSLRAYDSQPTGPTIFVVDDERVIAFTLSIILLQHGYRTLWFTEPAKALEAAVSDPPALLITDYNMPSMSGLELAVSMRSQCPDCRLMLISAQFGCAPIGPFARVRLAELNIYAKPIRIEDLLISVSDLLGL
jgi:DNA-binding NtrC family response regulator